MFLTTVREVHADYFTPFTSNLNSRMWASALLFALASPSPRGAAEAPFFSGSHEVSFHRMVRDVPNSLAVMVLVPQVTVTIILLPKLSIPVEAAM